jgi:hypothetical protein
MRLSALVVTPLVALALLGGAPARATDSAQGAFEEKLRAYDPAAAAAAQEFATKFDMQGMIQKALPVLLQRLSQQVAAKNPDLDEHKTEKFLGAFTQTLIDDNGRTVEQAVILDMLEVMSKDELEALNQFASTPTGVRALRKMPTLAARMPHDMEMMQTIVVPRALEEARALMRKDGVEVKI